jgi:hypothetical protein
MSAAPVAADTRTKSFFDHVLAHWWWAALVLAPVRILSALSMPIPDCDGTLGLAFWCLYQCHVARFQRRSIIWSRLIFCSTGTGCRLGSTGAPAAVCCCVRLILSRHARVVLCFLALRHWFACFRCRLYSPVYGLRSYFYLGFHWAIVKLGQLVWLDKVASFYFLRCVLGVVCACCEGRFVQASTFRFGLACLPMPSVPFCCCVERSRTITAVVLLVHLLGSGFFHSAIAYLPSTFAMYALLLAYAFWMVSACLCSALLCLHV